MKPKRWQAPLEVVVYFADPKQLWAEKVTQFGVIFHAQLRLPWIWLARFIARSNLGNTGNTCYMIRDGSTGEVIEDVPAEKPRMTCL